MGIINLNKPPGITSHKATKKVQKILSAYRAGHAGTLDPDAEGVLIVCLNEATRVTEYLADLEKEYLVQVQLGLKTDTYDLSGNIISEKDPSHITEQRLKEVVEEFVGEIQQEPPMYSAIKKDGIPLYRLARKGITVERKKRVVRIQSIMVLSFSLPEAILRVRCSKGTYIRSLVNDIGEKLGVGAVVKRLQRTRVGHFRVEEAVGFEDLERGTYSLITIDEALRHIPSLKLTPKQYRLARHGTGFNITMDLPENTLLRLLDPEEEKTFAIGRLRDSRMVKIEKVLIPL